MKNNLCLEVLKVLHQKSPLPFVDDTLKCIPEELEKEDEIEFREMDVLLCGKGARLCTTYLDRTLEFKNMFLSAAGTNVKDRQEVVSIIYMTRLKGEGCRFLEVMGEGQYKEKPVSGKNMFTGECYDCVKKTKGTL